MAKRGFGEFAHQGISLIDMLTEPAWPRESERNPVREKLEKQRHRVRGKRERERETETKIH